MIEANAESLSTFLKSKGAVVETVAQTVASAPVQTSQVAPLMQVVENTSSGLDTITKLLDSVANLVEKGSPLIQGIMKGAQRKAGVEMPSTVQGVQNGSTSLNVETIKEALRQVLSENQNSMNKDDLINKLFVLIDNWLLATEKNGGQITIKELKESWEKDEVKNKLREQFMAVL